MTRQFNARRLDLRSLAGEGATLTETSRVADHERLVAEAEGRGVDAPVAWTATGTLRNPSHVRPEVWLHLEASATLTLTCQRCLQPVEVPVAVDRDFRFAESEEAAAAEDDESEEDVLAESRAFDLVQLVEDELLMALPLVPRHDTCPPVNVSVMDPHFEGAPRENPFAVLGTIRTKPPSGR